MAKIDVLIIAQDDWGNVGWAFEQSLLRAGVAAKAVKLNPHVFEYPKQAQIVTVEDIVKLAGDAKGLLFMHGRVACSDIPRASKFCAVFHGGPAYRNNANAFNAVFDPMVERTLVAQAEMLYLGGKGATWIIPPVDTDAIESADFSLKGQITFAHFPRGEGKGSTTINDVMAAIERDESMAGKLEYLYETSQCSWEENLVRMARHDVYIEALVPGNDWRTTALEAAALGRIVMANHATKELYEEAYGPCPIIAVNSTDELEYEVRRLCRLNKLTVRKLHRDTRKWVEAKHGFEHTGEQLRKVFSPCL